MSELAASQVWLSTDRVQGAAPDDGTLVIGCPILDRAWIVGEWLRHIVVATEDAGVIRDRLTAVLVGDPLNDAATIDAGRSSADALGIALDVVPVHEAGARYDRSWTGERFKHLVMLRNLLLAQVRRLQPAHFWSVDSDVLVAPTALSKALDARSVFDAVGSRCYLTRTGRDYPSRAVRGSRGTLVRVDDDRVSGADVIMAVKLMSPRAYEVDYELHPLGEDFGWSGAAQRAGCRLGWDGTTTSKHVMTEDDLVVLDERCGF